VVGISPAGVVNTTSLPLNEGQYASDVTAVGGMLLYLVWNAEGQQEGIALWELEQGAARFILLPPTDFRITHMLPAAEGDRLALVLTEDGAAPGEAAWRLNVLPLAGGEQRTVITSEALTSPLPPQPFAWPADGPILLHALNVDGRSAGIYALNAADGSNRPLLMPDEQTVAIDPRLSPDATQIAYLSYADDLLPPEVRDSTPTNVLHVIDLRLGTTTVMLPPEGQAIFGARWAGDALLLDIVTLQAEQQSWALVEVGQPLPWALYEGGAGRANLFDYEPYQGGVAYTTLPADGLWRVYLQPALDAAPEVIPLNALSAQQGAPRIFNTP
jgi:hypothetical protein